jgi:tetratricopeptide (TPR) repeat protein
VREHPKVFAAFAALGSAYLAKARETHEAEWLVKARTAIERSLKIQPNLNALVTMAEICNFGHRFACGLEFAKRASQTIPLDPRLLPLRVEAHLGLGQLEAAAKLLEPHAHSSTPPFGMLGARGRWFAEQERFDEAHASFVAAAAQGREEGSNDLVIWAETNAAGMLIDSERSQPALQHLKAAAALETNSWPIQAVLQVHWAEWHELEHRPAEALAVYESMLARQADPESFRRAFVLAQKLDRMDQAQALLSSGERAAERILAAGEIFALEAHARLYADAGVNLERAEELARRNLSHKQDRSARETLEYVQQRRRELAVNR